MSDELTPAPPPERPEVGADTWMVVGLGVAALVGLGFATLAVLLVLWM